MPRPKSRNDDNGFALRLISEADQRFSVVKTMRSRLEALKDDAGISSIQKEWLAARAVFLVGFCESQEVDALEGKRIDWKQYLMAARALSDVLNKLGLNREVRSAQRLTDYLVEARNGKNEHH